MSRERVFDRIYRRNEWNGGESLSGPGSSWVTTRHTVAGILQIVGRFGINSVLNVGCGDDFWTPELPGYVGVDVAPAALERARKFHPDRKYLLGANEWPETPDLVICRDVLQHLSFETGQALLARLKRGQWMLLSTYLTGTNEDIKDGGYHSPDLATLPYNLGPPLLMIFDGWSYDTGEEYRDPRKFLGLW